MTQYNWLPTDNINLSGLELAALNQYFELMNEDLEEKVKEANKTLALVEARKALGSIIQNNISSGVINTQEFDPETELRDFTESAKQSLD